MVILQQQASGQPVAQIVREHGLSEATRGSYYPVAHGRHDEPVQRR